MSVCKYVTGISFFLSRGGILAAANLSLSLPDSLALSLLLSHSLSLSLTARQAGLEAITTTTTAWARSNKAGRPL